MLINVAVDLVDAEASPALAAGGGQVGPHARRVVAEAERDQLLDVFSRQKQDLLDMEAAAAAAVASRDNAQQQLERIAAQRKAAAKETAHVHAECSDLEHLPVCPAVAERLWGEGQDAPAAPRH